MAGPPAEDLLRRLAPQVLGVVVRRYGDFDGAEDAVQEALLEAATTWPERGLPRDPRAWLVTVAHRRLVDLWRSDSARRAREERVRVTQDVVPPDPSDAPYDDSLELLLLCCHPALTAPSQVALTLRAVGGLTTAEIARALLLPEATVGQRISRAKAGIRKAGARFELPAADELEARIAVVSKVLYLIYTEGHTASSGTSLQRLDLAAEAIRLTRMLHARAAADPSLAGLPADEVTGLLALLMLTTSRRKARADASGALVPLDRQDRSLWDRALIEEASALVEGVLREGPIGAYQLEAAVAAAHAHAPSYADTDWREILGLYDLLRQVAPGPMVELNRVVALAEVAGPRVALDELGRLASDPALAGRHRLPAVRAHLRERLGELDTAVADYRESARLTRSDPERRYLLGRAAALER